MVFFAEQVSVGLPLDTAAVRLANLTRGGGLASASHRAYRNGTEAMLRVGPLGDVPPLAKIVHVRFLDPAWSQRGMTVGFRWEAAGGTTALFPVLDADLVLSPVSPGTCTLACSGVYRPPLGRIGAAAGAQPAGQRRPHRAAGHQTPRTRLGQASRRAWQGLAARGGSPPRAPAASRPAPGEQAPVAAFKNPAAPSSMPRPSTSRSGVISRRMMTRPGRAAYRRPTSEPVESHSSVTIVSSEHSGRAQSKVPPTGTSVLMSGPSSRRPPPGRRGRNGSAKAARPRR